MKLIDILNKPTITEAEKRFGFKKFFAEPKINLKGKDGKSEVVEFLLKVSDVRAYGWIQLEFKPKGAKNRNLILAMEQESDFVSSKFKVVPSQIAKYVQSKVGLPVEIDPVRIKNVIRVEINTNNILKKLK
jgi:hypothetical protein